MTLQIVAVNDASPGACVDTGLTWNGSTTLTSTQIIAGTSFTASGTSAVTGNFAVNTDKFAVLAASGNTTIAGTLTQTGAVAAAASITLGAGADLIGSATSDITINTDKFTVAGATGNTVVAGTCTITGTLTQTGAATFGGAVVMGATADAAAHGAVALSITELFTLVSSDADSNQAATLADGADGQMKIIKMETDGGNDVVLTPANFRDGATITFDNANEILILVFGDSTWNLVYTDATVG